MLNSLGTLWEHMRTIGGNMVEFVGNFGGLILHN